MKKIFIILLIILIIIGFAIFLNIFKYKKTNSKDSWNVEISNIESKDKTGSAYDAEKPIYNKTSATFKTILVYPNDSITYYITIKNKGNIDAKLKKIKINKSNNPAIIIETSGVKEKDILKKGKKQILKVKIKYSDNIKSKPDELKGSVKIKLDYIQKS